MNLTKAALELDAIRNDRTSSQAELIARVDRVGAWVATQKITKKVMQLQDEAHTLFEHLNGNTGFKVGKQQIRFAA